MKAICIEAIAPSGGLRDEFKIHELPLPNPDRKQIRVKVAYATINIDDIRIAEGRFPVPGQSVTPSKDNPYVPGHDFAGLVEAVGEDVERLKVGDRVYGHAKGSWAEFCIADEATTGIVPHAWSLQQAASYVMGAAVAKAAIDKLGEFAGKTGLIIGASGGIGNIALNYLARNNATVWAVCSNRNEALVLELGAERVFDYTKAPFEEQVLANGAKVDFVLDFVGGKETEQAAYQVLKSTGRFVSAVGPINFSQDIDVSTWGMIKVAAYLVSRTFLIPRFIRPKYYFAVMPINPNYSTPLLGEEVVALIDSEHEFSQAGIANAIDRVMSHRAAGKVLLSIGKEQPSPSS